MVKSTLDIYGVWNWNAFFFATVSGLSTGIGGKKRKF